MSYRTLMVISAVIAIVFGVSFILIPETLASLYGLRLDAAGVFVGRLLGVEFLGFGLLAWLVRNAEDSGMRQTILLVFLITDTIGFLVALLTQLSGILNVLGWSIVGVFLLLSLGWGYLRFASPEATKP